MASKKKSTPKTKVTAPKMPSFPYAAERNDWLAARSAGKFAAKKKKAKK
jgi:hypothetical protein